jgi:hypothetical protein
MLEVGAFHREAAELRARGSIGYAHGDDEDEPTNIIRIARGPDGIVRAHGVVRRPDGRLAELRGHAHDEDEDEPTNIIRIREEDR